MTDWHRLEIPDLVVDAYRLDRLPLDRPRRTTVDLLRLDGVRALVTGGGGDGLGNATCHRLAEQGARVAVLDIAPAAAEETVTQLRDRWQADALAVVADIGDWDQVRAAVDEVVASFGGIDLLVNNAGGSGAIGVGGRPVHQHGEFNEIDLADVETIVRVNLVGTLLVTRAVLDDMRPRGAGRILNVSSEGGKVGTPGLATYNACKSAVIGFTENLAAEVGPEGIGVAAVCPGIMVTERTLQRMAAGGGAAFSVLDRAFSRVSRDRCSVPDEVASMIAFLASDAGAYVHGTAVSVGGGLATTSPTYRGATGPRDVQHGQPPELLAGIPEELVARLRLGELPFDQRDRRIEDLLDLRGAVAVVTGGGGRGLGQAIVHRLASLGADVAVLDVDGTAAQRVADAAADRWGVRTRAITTSIADAGQARRGIDDAVDELGRLDVLVNNAGGVFGAQWGLFAERTPDQLREVVELNLLGTMYVTLAALRHLVPAGAGRIINVSSEGGRIGMRGLATYNACKAGVIGFTRNLASDVGPLGIGVVGVAPGVMVSDGLLDLIQSGRTAGLDAVELGITNTTAGRPSLPEEVANMVAFLAGDAGAYVQATTVSVGGGLAD